jgi:hypothetical protein
MGSFAKLAFGVLAISFMVFVTFFGRLPALRSVSFVFLDFSAFHLTFSQTHTNRLVVPCNMGNHPACLSAS